MFSAGEWRLSRQGVSVALGSPAFVLQMGTPHPVQKPCRPPPRPKLARQMGQALGGKLRSQRCPERLGVGSQ